MRDVACVASGRFVRAFPEESRDKLDVLFPHFVANLKDSISSVRQGAALSITSVVETYQDDVIDR